MKKQKEIQIGFIGNYYGGLHIKKHEGKFYWIIQNWDTDFDNIGEYQEIPESLYTSLLNFEKNKK